MDRKTVTDEQELRIRRQADEFVSRVRRGVIPFDSASSRLQAIIMGTDSVEKPDAKKRDLAEEEREWWQTWYYKLGFSAVQVSKPEVSNREFARFKKSQAGLIFVPATSCAFYELFMIAVGLGVHQTVVDTYCEGIVWEINQPATGYWLKVDISQECPRLGTSWEVLRAETKLLTLLEYAITWHALRARIERTLDTNSWSWLRTGYRLGRDLGALRAGTIAGQFCVNGVGSYILNSSDDRVGGRTGEVVPNAV